MTTEVDRELRHVVIIGPTGAGKSTLARKLAAIIGSKHIELDSLYHQPNWRPAEIDEFHARIRDALVGSERWVSDGNYRIARPVVWPEADTLVWLDYSFPRTFSRLIRRTTLRRVRNEELWNGNRESLRSHFFSKDSLLWWAISTHWRHRRSYPEEFARYPNLRVIHFHNPRETEAWLRGIERRFSAAAAERSR